MVSNADMVREWVSWQLFLHVVVGLMEGLMSRLSLEGQKDAVATLTVFQFLSYHIHM